MKLNKIDFSDGIRPEEIQENFEMLQDQINRERLGVGGYGLSYGFNITTHIDEPDFYIEVSEASIVNEKGEEIYIPGCKIDIDLPELYTTLEYKTINYNNQIDLKHIPYSISRRRPSEYVPRDPKFSGIYINYPSNSYNTDDYIRVSNITGTILTITGAINREVVVRYSYTADRIDMVYLTKDNEVAVAKGSTSSSPSYPAMPADGKYVIAYIMIESRYMDENNLEPIAYMYIREDATSKRNLYTDKNNDLWLCGTKFDDLQIIHMTKPKDPTPNTLWLSTDDNTLYCWRSTDSFAYRNEIGIEQDRIDVTFLDFSTYMDFEVDNNELEVYHNGNKLLKNVQYYEIYKGEPSVIQEIPVGEKSNVFRIIENNNFRLKAGDKLTYVINYKDSHFMWVPVNKMTYLNAKNYRFYCTNDYMPNNEGGYFDSSIARAMGGDDYEYKYQYFIFHKDKDLEMHFTPGRNELTVLINQMILHHDQYEELTAYDLLDMADEHPVRRAAAAFYGWTTHELTKLKENAYDSIGIGFKLAEPLDSGLNANSQPYYMADGSSDLYVEAIVERRYCATPMKRKLQRTATFVAEETLMVDDFIKETGIITLPEGEHYRYDEHQLEVFVNGYKISGLSGFHKKIYDKEKDEYKSYVFNIIPEYIEEFGCCLQSPYEGVEDKVYPPLWEVYEDKEDYFIRNKARQCSIFKILRSLNIGDIITYRITTNVYSYDHINEILDDLETRIDVDLRSSIATKEEIFKFKETIEARVVEAEQKVEKLNNDIGEINNKPSIGIDDKGIITEGNIEEAVVQKMIMSLDHINIKIKFEGNYSFIIRDNNNEIADIRPTDYLVLIKKDINGFTHYMMPSVDYEITLDKSRENKPTPIITLLNIDDWDGGEDIYITGIKFKYGR